MEQYVHLIRHGASLYRQQNVPISEASDLTYEGKCAVRASSKNLANMLWKRENPLTPVPIWSSPRGRTLHSAKELTKVFRFRDVQLLREPIEIVEDLREVDNFSWDLFRPLFEGGEVKLPSGEYKVDKTVTNPKNVDYATYFNEDLLHDLSNEAKSKLPGEYLYAISNFERASSVTERMLKTVRWAYKAAEQYPHVIMVTHDALVGHPTRIFSEGKIRGLSPGTYLTLHSTDDGTRVVNLNGERKGDSKTDIVRAFYK